MLASLYFQSFFKKFLCLKELKLRQFTFKIRTLKVQVDFAHSMMYSMLLNLLKSFNHKQKYTYIGTWVDRIGRKEMDSLQEILLLLM